MANNKSNKKPRLSSKGLDKIFGEGINDVIKEIENNEELKENASEIALSEILANPHQPRKIFNDEELKELSMSIKEHGIIQPVIVKKSTNGYYLVAGERRVRASKLAGLDKIPAIVVDFDDQKMKEIALIENIQRVDLSPIEEANAYKELIDLLEVTQEELAARIGKSRSYITNLIRLLTLPQEIQNYVLEGKLTMGQVRPLITLQADVREVKELAKRIINENLNARQVEELVRDYNTNSNIKFSIKNKKEEKRTVNEVLESKIMRKLGTKVKIDNNKITINYIGVKDLNRILSILGLIEE